MTNRFKSLADRQLFWKTLFEEKKLAAQLPVLATDHIDGVTYDDMPEFGKMHILVQSASSLGDNFMSDTFIVTAQLTKRDAAGNETKNTLSTFIKVLPSNAMLRIAAYESRTHHREIDVYQNFFGLLRKMHADHSIPLDVPDVYYTHLEEIVPDGADGSGICTLLEDLKAEGYRMAGKMEGADYRHCHMALTSLAHYHVLTMSAVRKWKDPTTGQVEGADYRHCHMALTSLAHYHALTLSAVRKWKDSSTGELSKIPPEANFIIEGKTMYDSHASQMIKDSVQNVIKFAEDVERPDIVEWITSLRDRLSEIVLIDTLDSCGPLACILHGDYWNNNMMFKYDDDDSKKPIALKMIDFQIVRFGHPVSDILYFLYTSTKPETRARYMKILLRNYFDTLTADLRLLNISLNYYTWEDFLADCKKRSLMWMFMGTMVLSFVLNKKVLTKLDEMDTEERLKEPKVSDEGTVKGTSGMSLEVEESMRNMIASHKLSDNAVLTDRLIKLIDEVKSLNDS